MLFDFCGVGLYCGGVCVVVLYLVEVFNVVVLNVLLKMLEELLFGVVFLFVLVCIDCLLLIIISCCC